MKAICCNTCACLVTTCRSLVPPLSGAEALLQVLQRSVFFFFFRRLVLYHLFWRMHSRLCTPTFFKSCSSSKTSSMTCAHPFHGRGVVMLCNVPAPPSALSSRSFSSLPAFLLASSVSTKLPISQHKFVHVARPSLLASLSQLTDIPTQTFADATYRTHFPHNHTSNVLSCPIPYLHLHFFSLSFSFFI